MGYYTEANIFVERVDGKDFEGHDEDFIRDVMERLLEVRQDEKIEQCCDIQKTSYRHTYWFEKAKWVCEESLVEPLRKLSYRAPNMLFVVEGQGEQIDDRWKHYIHNEMSKRSILTWTPPPKKWMKK